MKCVYITVIIAVMLLAGASSKKGGKSKSSHSGKSSKSSPPGLKWPTCDLCDSVEVNFNQTAETLSEILEILGECTTPTTCPPPTTAPLPETCPPPVTCPESGKAVEVVSGPSSTGDSSEVDCPDGYFVVGCTCDIEAVCLGPEVSPTTPPTKCTVFKLPGETEIIKAVATCVPQDSCTYTLEEFDLCPSNTELIQCFNKATVPNTKSSLDFDDEACFCSDSPNCGPTIRALCRS